MSQRLCAACLGRFMSRTPDRCSAPTVSKPAAAATNRLLETYLWMGSRLHISSHDCGSFARNRAACCPNEAWRLFGTRAGVQRGEGGGVQKSTGGKVIKNVWGWQVDRGQIKARGVTNKGGGLQKGGVKLKDWGVQQKQAGGSQKKGALEKMSK